MLTAQDKWKLLFEAAEKHGRDSGVEYETGDLLDILSACAERLSDEDKEAVFTEMLEHPLYGLKDIYEERLEEEDG